jgi:hypothetical protein
MHINSIQAAMLLSGTESLVGLTPLLINTASGWRSKQELGEFVATT